MAVRDTSLARIEDITEDEANITVPLNLPSTTSMSTSSSEYSEMSGRLLKYRSRAYRKRLSRSIEQISASSNRSTQSYQNLLADSEQEVSDDNDSLASDNVFGSQEEQIKFLKQTLIQYNKELENYKIVNADLTRKLEKCKKRGREVEKMLENALWDKLKLLNKYKRLQRRFNVPETPPGEVDSSPSDSSGAPGNGARLGTPIRRPRKRGNSGADRRDEAGPSKRSTVLRCGLDRQMERTSNSSSEASDSGSSLANLSDSVLLAASDSSRKSRNRSISPTNKPDSNGPDCNEPDCNEPDCNEPDCNEPDSNEPDSNEPDSNEPDSNEPDSNEPDSNEPDSNEPDSNEPDSNGKEDDKNEECDNLSTPSSTSMTNVPDSNGKDDGECSNLSTPSSMFRANHSDHFNHVNILDDEELDPDHGMEDGSQDDHSDNGRSTPTQRKRRLSSASESSGAGSKRTKSSSSPSDTAGTDSSSDSSSDRSSLPPRRSRSPSPPLPFRDVPGVIPGAPIPAGTRKRPRFWQRNGSYIYRNVGEAKG